MWFLPPTSFLSSGGSFLKDLSAGRFITCHDLGIICWTVLLFFLIPVAKKSRSFGFQGHILYCSHFHAVNTTRRHTDVIPFANWKTPLSWSSWRNIRLLTVFWGYLSPDTLSMGGDSWVSSPMTLLSPENVSEGTSQEHGSCFNFNTKTILKREFLSHGCRSRPYCQIILTPL